MKKILFALLLICCSISNCLPDEVMNQLNNLNDYVHNKVDQYKSDLANNMDVDALALHEEAKAEVDRVINNLDIDDLLEPDGDPVGEVEGFKLFILYVMENGFNLNNNAGLGNQLNNQLEAMEIE
jgi:hypothetical protein